MAATQSEHVFAVTTETFAAQVLERSAQVPVVVDFWAPWCGPCRALTPVLTRAIEALGGRVLLATLNTDEHPALAQRFQISGIPAVKAFRDGQVVDEFVGARDARAVAAFLQKLAPSAAAQALAEARRALSAGEAAAARALLRPLMDEALPLEEGAAARVLLAEALLVESPEEARALLQGVDPRSEAAQRAEVLERLLAFYAAADEGGGEEAARARVAAGPKDWDARYALAAALARRGAVEEALEELLAIVSRDRRYREDGARKAMLLLFEVQGAQSELAVAFRRRLQLVL